MKQTTVICSMIVLELLRRDLQNGTWILLAGNVSKTAKEPALVEGLLTFGISSMILDKSVVVRGNGGIQQHVLNLQGRITCVTKVLGPRSRC